MKALEYKKKLEDEAKVWLAKKEKLEVEELAAKRAQDQASSAENEENKSRSQI